AAAAGGVVLGDDLPRARSGFPALPPSLFGESAAFPERGLPSLARETAAVPPTAATSSPAPGAAAAAARPHPFRNVGSRYLQILDLYLLLEGPDGLLVVDQHALHERVVYEQLRAQHAARAVAVQRLLVPAVVELAPAELAWCEAAAEALAAEGLLVEPFGPGTVAVHGLPAVLAKTDPRRLVQALVAGDPPTPNGPLRDHVAERFHSLACRSAVMSGDRLDDAEIQALLAAAATLEHPHNCPHGRPTVLTFTSAELERYFRRRC
ncbi:MAG: hypothetical protein WBO45_25385, partial [Planctomycetota bacterium]